MLRDIVVHIPVDRPAKPLIDYATSAAALFGAHLDGIICDYQRIDPAIAFGAAAGYVVMPSPSTCDTEAAATRIAEFEAAARSAGISHGSRTVSDIPGLANAMVPELSRLYDLCIVAQPDPSSPSYYDILPEAVLFGSGRPMLLVPYIHSGPFRTDRAMICWDGGRPAARAVHDAMTILRQAKAIDVLAINEDGESQTGASPASSAALIAHLQRQGLAAKPHRFKAEPDEIHNVILSMAADNGSDLIVMGGYGHSRLREFVLGGVTRGIFNSLTVPALMSH